MTRCDHGIPLSERCERCDQWQRDDLPQVFMSGFDRLWLEVVRYLEFWTEARAA